MKIKEDKKAEDKDLGLRAKDLVIQSSVLKVSSCFKDLGLRTED